MFALGRMRLTIGGNSVTGRQDMALTLVEASKLSNDTLVAGVVETIAQESPVLQRLPFSEMTYKESSHRDLRA